MRPSEEFIEKYILDRSSLPEKEIRWIEAWIRDDEEVRLLAEWFQTFYQSVNTIEEGRERSENVPSAITLTSISEKSIYSGGPMLLAAQTQESNGSKKTLQSIQTYISEENRTILRILFDDSNQVYRVNVISEFLQDEDVVLFEGLDSESSMLISEPGGSMLIPGHKIPEQRLKKLKTLVLHLPLSTVKVYHNKETDTLNFDTILSHCEREELNLERADDELHISFHSSLQKIPVKSVIYNSQSSTMHPLKNGRCTFLLDQFSSTDNTLFFY